MLLPRETELAKRIRVTVEEMQSVLRKQGQQTPSHIVSGSLYGTGTGVLAGVALVSGIIPGGEALQAFGLGLPIMLGSFSAGVGMIIGAFAEMSPASNIWRNED